VACVYATYFEWFTCEANIDFYVITN
jgi:hypothetical protein